MSSSTPSPPSLHSDQDLEDSRDSTSSEFTNEISKYRTNNLTDISQKADCKVSTITSHGVEDILSEGVNYSGNDNVFQDCKTEVLSSIPHSFVQDYNSRDSTGFSIQDILGLHQPYNPVNTQEDIESRYGYQIVNYENISNSSNNNYGSGTDELISEDCGDKSNCNMFNTPPIQVGSQVAYNRNYATNEPVRYHSRSGLDNDIVKDPGKEINDLHESSFPGQVNKLQSKSNLKTVVINITILIH